MGKDVFDDCVKLFGVLMESGEIGREHEPRKTVGFLAGPWVLRVGE